MPEGDALHRAARNLQVLVGETLAVEAVHPRARAAGVAERLDGRVLESVEARGKNLLLRFEGGRVLRSHLRMNGSWRVLPAAAETPGLPWLVLRGRERKAVLRGGSVLELSDRATWVSGRTSSPTRPTSRRWSRAFAPRDQRRELGEALLDQRLIAGIGNVWRAEALWETRLSPWLRLGETADTELKAVLSTAAQMMRLSLAGDGNTRAASTAEPAARALAAARRSRAAARATTTELPTGVPACQKGEGSAGQ